MNISIKYVDKNNVIGSVNKTELTLNELTNVGTIKYLNPIKISLNHVELKRILTVAKKLKFFTNEIVMNVINDSFKIEMNSTFDYEKIQYSNFFAFACYDDKGEFNKASFIMRYNVDYFLSILSIINKEQVSLVIEDDKPLIIYSDDNLFLLAPRIY